jgi:hypothetical protein
LISFLLIFIFIFNLIVIQDTIHSSLAPCSFFFTLDFLFLHWRTKELRFANVNTKEIGEMEKPRNYVLPIPPIGNKEAEVSVAGETTYSY